MININNREQRREWMSAAKRYLKSSLHKEPRWMKGRKVSTLGELYEVLGVTQDQGKGWGRFAPSEEVITDLMNMLNKNDLETITKLMNPGSATDEELEKAERELEAVRAELNAKLKAYKEENEAQKRQIQELTASVLRLTRILENSKQ